MLHLLWEGGRHVHISHAYTTAHISGRGCSGIKVHENMNRHGLLCTSSSFPYLFPWQQLCPRIVESWLATSVWCSSIRWKEGAHFPRMLIACADLCPCFITVSFAWDLSLAGKFNEVVQIDELSMWWLLVLF